MAEISRYNEGVTSRGGRRTATSVHRIRTAIRTGNLQVNKQTLNENERLDHVAHRVYGDGRLWWVIAAASDIGWAMQAPAGTLIKIPDLNDVLRIIA